MFAILSQCPTVGPIYCFVGNKFSLVILVIYQYYFHFSTRQRPTRQPLCTLQTLLVVFRFIICNVIKSVRMKILINKLSQREYQKWQTYNSRFDSHDLFHVNLFQIFSISFCILYTFSSILLTWSYNAKRYRTICNDKWFHILILKLQKTTDYNVNTISFEKKNRFWHRWNHCRKFIVSINRKCMEETKRIQEKGKWTFISKYTKIKFN